MSNSSIWSIVDSSNMKRDDSLPLPQDSLSAMFAGCYGGRISIVFDSSPKLSVYMYGFYKVEFIVSRIEEPLWVSLVVSEGLSTMPYSYSYYLKKAALPARSSGSSMDSGLSMPNSFPRSTSLSGKAILKMVIRVEILSVGIMSSAHK